MCMRAAVTALILTFISPTVAAGDQDGPLQAVLDSARVAMGVTGASAALLLPDGTDWEGASGMAAPGTPVSPATAFELGSVTKTYTAALVLQLETDGLVSVDDPLSQWFPELPGAERITLRHLLAHTHGLHDPLQEPEFVPSVLQAPTHVWTLDDVLDRMQPPLFEPGAEWRYSNAGYHLLGAIVEAITEAPFDQVMAARVFAPLALTSTWYGIHDPDGVPLAAAYIDPSGSGTPQPVSLVMPWTAFRSSAGPAGAVVATAADAARWLHALATGSVLGEEQWARMTTWVDRPDGNRYGLGILKLEEEGRPLLGHKGNSAGYSAAAFHDPTSGATVVVLTNAHATDVTPVATALLKAATHGAFPP
jgi:D-alanyl-D-alanine carboxypeptidase